MQINLEATQVTIIGYQNIRRLNFRRWKIRRRNICSPNFRFRYLQS